jgi:hypothetical protein
VPGFFEVLLLQENSGTIAPVAAALFNLSQKERGGGRG